MKTANIILLVVLNVIISTSSLSVLGVSGFLKEFVNVGDRARLVVSFLEMDTGAVHQMAKKLAEIDIAFSSVSRIPSNIIEEHTIFIADLFYVRTVELLKKAESQGMLKSPSRWVLFVDRSKIFVNFPRLKALDFIEKNKTFAQDDELMEEGNITAQEWVSMKLIGIHLRVFSEILITSVDNEQYEAKMGNDLITFAPVYRRRPDLPLVWESFGLWCSCGGFIDLRSNQVTSLRRRNFEKTPITVCTVLTDNNSVNHMSDYVDTHIDTVSKVNHYFTQHMIEFMNGTARVKYVDSWGFRQPDGSYDGMIRELGSGKADIAGTPLIMDTDRMLWVEYVCVNSPMKAVFIFRKPPLSSVANIFLLPFSAGVWLSMLGLIAVVSVCILVTWVWEDSKSDIQLEQSPRQRVENAFLDSLCMVFQQGTWKEPKFSSGRTVLLIGLISFMFLFTAYSAYIVALLQSTTNINTLEGLLASPLRLAVQDTLYNRFFFPTETETTRKAIWEQKLVTRGENTFLPVDEGIKLMREGLFAFHVEKTTAYDLVQKTFYEDEKCQFKEIEFLQITHPYFSVAGDSPFKELFKIGSKRVMESGLQSRTNSRILTGTPRCAGDGGTFVAVRLADCAPALHCLLLGCAAALLLLAAELAVHRRAGGCGRP